MNNAIYNFELPANEPVLEYLRGSRERIELDKELKRQANLEVDIPLIIGGKEIRTGNLEAV
ncbi:MAG: 1-pyrroline-5-carboxylate dehydrogenase, partial [Bacteroidota bacterium]